MRRRLFDAHLPIEFIESSPNAPVPRISVPAGSERYRTVTPDSAIKEDTDVINSEFGVIPPLPVRRNAPPKTPSALARRQAFARRHPEITISPRRQLDGRLVFEVSVPGGTTATYDDAGAMMSDLEGRYT